MLWSIPPTVHTAPGRSTALGKKVSWGWPWRPPCSNSYISFYICFHILFSGAVRGRQHPNTRNKYLNERQMILSYSKNLSQQTGKKLVVLLALLVGLLFKDWVIVVNCLISFILPPSEGQACVILSSLGSYWSQVGEWPPKYFWATN